jgi:alkylation response protein AidB-like acyl-CoA dehydrogenase
MAAEASARALCERAATLLDSRAPSTQAVLLAKYVAAEAARRSTDTCLQLHGASGFSENALPARLARDARVMDVIEGSSELLQSLLGAAALRTYL